MPTSEKAPVALCGMKKRNKQPCQNRAGMGTDHPGVGVCKFHGGNSPNQIKQAARIFASSLFNEPEIEANEALIRVVKLDWGAIQWCASQISHWESLLGPLTAREANGETLNDEDARSAHRYERNLLQFQSVYGEWLDRAARHAKMALDAGVEERRVRLAESEGELVAGVIRGVLMDLGLTPEQQVQAPTIVRARLLALDAASTPG